METFGYICFFYYLVCLASYAVMVTNASMVRRKVIRRVGDFSYPFSLRLRCYMHDAINIVPVAIPHMLPWVLNAEEAEANMLQTMVSDLALNEGVFDFEDPGGHRKAEEWLKELFLTP